MLSGPPDTAIVVVVGAGVLVHLLECGSSHGHGGGELRQHLGNEVGSFVGLGELLDELVKFHVLRPGQRGGDHLGAVGERVHDLPRNRHPLLPQDPALQWQE